jgi:hypothetical protein
MTPIDHHQDDSGLDALLESAARQPPRPSGDLTERVLADAHAMQPVPRRAGWQRLRAMLGGAPGLSGLATATLVGFWIGVAPPEGLPDLAQRLLAPQAVDAIEAATLDGLLESDSFGWMTDEG